jgi:hypothetical protein
MKQIFKIEGYQILYYLNGKYWGCKNIDKPDREKCGYEGGQETELTENITIGKKTLKKGTIIRTELYPLTGRILK